MIDQLVALNRRGRKRSSNPVVRDVVRIPIKLKTLNERYGLFSAMTIDARLQSASMLSATVL